MSRRGVYAAVIEFPRMRVGVSIEDGRLTAIRYLPPDTALVAPQCELAERAMKQTRGSRRDGTIRHRVCLRCRPPGGRRRGRSWALRSPLKDLG